MDDQLHKTPLLLVAGLGGSPILPEHPLEKSGEPLLVPDQGIQAPIAKDLHARFRAKSSNLKVYEHLAPRASRRKLNHLININFIDKSFKLPPQKTGTNAQYPDGSQFSPLSPRNPGSDLYPNGLISTLWLQKYLHLVPGTVVSFYALSQDSSEDPKLIDDLNALKLQLDKYGIKLVVAVIADETHSERISNLRRATGLAQRTGLLYVPTNSSTLEKETFVESVCLLAYGQALEFYTSVSRHIRKKRTNVHPNQYHSEEDSTETPPLPSAGWEVRYLYKLAVMCEFRQDLSGALRSYEETYEALLELCEAFSPSGELASKHWAETFSLLDQVSFNMWKMCIYLEQPNLAYRKFQLHLSAVDSLARRKGVYEAESQAHIEWLANQHSKLAQLIDYTQGTVMGVDSPYVADSEDFDSPVRLPRSGYLRLQAARLLKGVSESPQTNEKVVAELRQAIADYQLSDKHSRAVAGASLQLASVSKDDESSANYLKEALKVYRKDNWVKLEAQCLKRLLKLPKSVLSLEERLDYYVGLRSLDKSSASFELEDVVDLPSEGVQVSGASCPVIAEATFESPQIHISLPAKIQVTLIPKGEWTLDSLAIDVEANPEFKIQHDANHSELEVTDKANLHLDKPRTIQLTYHPDQLGVVRIKTIQGSINFGKATYNFSVPIKANRNVVPWRTPSSTSTHYKRISNPLEAEVFPRPARIKLSTVQAIANAFPGEKMSIDLCVDNQEDEDIDMKLDCRVSSGEGKDLAPIWKQDAKGNSIIQKPGQATYPLTIEVPHSGASALSIEFTAIYVLSSDSVEVKDALSLSVPVIKPFRVNFDVSPRPHPDPWPSMFVLPEDLESLTPIILKRWCLSAQMLFLGEGTVEILGTNLDVSADEDSEIKLVEESDLTNKLVGHNESLNFKHLFDTTRKGLKDVRTVAAEARLRVQWKRKDAGESASEVLNEFKVPLVRLNLPHHEPRVILDYEWIKDDDSANYVKLVYYIENCTAHVLNYSISMGSSAVWAFRGPKNGTLRALPFSRRQLEYVLFPLADGPQLKLPQLRVHDVHYKRTLSVLPASEGINTDKGELYIVRK